MKNKFSPKYHMKLVDDIEKAIWEQFQTNQKIIIYIVKWQISDGIGPHSNHNFYISLIDK